jgi:hypothetical protein
MASPRGVTYLPVTTTVSLVPPTSIVRTAASTNSWRNKTVMNPDFVTKRFLLFHRFDRVVQTAERYCRVTISTPSLHAVITLRRKLFIEGRTSLWWGPLNERGLISLQALTAYFMTRSEPEVTALL